ncbi:protein of unknown function [Taphrina deformans PYCC 5710]|uniref:Uncharacterized protein n=1 Tax=Taphrina deformans (strain PYCC 5710 / ATCC 11124 / CBS 356.35 / IMI 108563 / JCM 9778 / NBRC 8474) TaxID=1097556 RepID=R4XG64_TAPDE|nr:protein of unknown function [Taphrina deformans PYCC 5710]|eukprot:CCG83484.1 protein of unknown function [Taphrina deformans PYCC 5710]
MQLNAVALLLFSALHSASALVVSRNPEFDRFPSSLACPVGHGRVVFIKDQEIYAGFRHNVRKSSGTIIEYFATSIARGVPVSMRVAVDVGQGAGGRDKVIYNSGTAKTSVGPCTAHGDAKSS